MDDKVVPFKKPEPKDRLVLVCARCDCSTHYIHDDMGVECANCGQDIQVDGELRIEIPLPSETLRTTEGGMRVTNIGSPRAACAAVLGDIRRWHDAETLEVLVGYTRDGVGRSWLSLKTEADRQYILDRIDDMKAHVAKAKLETE